MLEYWRRQQGVVTRRSQSTQISIAELDLALCVVTTIQLATLAEVRRQLAPRGFADLLFEVPSFYSLVSRLTFQL